MGQPADLLHFRQVLVGQREAVALGRVDLAVGRAVRALVLGYHLFSAAGVAGDARAAERIVRRGQSQLDQRPRNADEAAGVAAGHSHPAGVLDLLFLALQLREAIVPCRVGAEGRGGIQHLDVRAEQGHDLSGSRIGQAEEGEVCGVDDAGPLVHVLAALGGDAQKLDLRPGRQTVRDAQTGGAGGTVDKNFHAHALFASHASTCADASAI